MTWRGRLLSAAGARRLAVLLLLGALAGCQSSRDPAERLPMRDINAVLDEHAAQLLAIPGVTGVYIGLARDGSTPCLKVMAVQATAALRRQVPRRLEGYAVVIEETGVIRPLAAP